MDLLTRLFFLLSIFTSFSTAFAGAYETPACHRFALQTPCNPRGETTYGLEFLYTLPANDDLLLREKRTSSSSHDLILLHSVYGLSVRLMANTTLGHNLDAAVNWMHSNISNQNVFKLSSVTDSLGNTTFNFDQFNAELGERINIGPRLGVRLHGGLSYASLGHSLQDHTHSTSLPYDYIVGTESYWQGAGIRFGADAAYLLSGPWDFVLSGSAGLYAGNLTGKYAVQKISKTTGQLISALEEAELTGSKIIPGGEVKVGLRYTHDSRHARAIFEFGYVVDALLHSILHIRVTPVGLGHAAGHGIPVDPELINSTISNYSLHGPYVTFRVLFY